MFQLPAGSRVINKLHPKSQWGWSELLANKTNFLLEYTMWLNATPPKKAKEADKKKHRDSEPKLWLPDFMQEPKKPSPINNEAVALDIEEIKDILNRNREQPEPVLVSPTEPDTSQNP